MTHPHPAQPPKRPLRLVLAAVAIVVGALVPAGLDTLAGAEPSEGASVATSLDQRRISAGLLHSCAVLDSGEVQCWGANDNGQLGNGTTAASTIPQTAGGITTALNVSAGGTHTCALIHDGTVRCWGNNGSGQLGNGLTSLVPVVNPVEVAGLDDAVAISSGGFHSCAVRAGGSVVCWGDDGSGQLGDGTAGDTSTTPTAVLHDHDADATTAAIPLSGATAVAAGEYHSCAILNSGGVACWGHNGFGQLGNGTALPNGVDSAVAVNVVGLPVLDGHTVVDDGHGPHKALAIAAGEGHTCAVIEGKPGDADNDVGNTAMCWGHNFYGQLGNNTTFTLPHNQGGTDSSTPVAVKVDVNTDPLAPADIQPLEGVTAITAGQFHSCAGKGDGTAWCWGNNGRGQLGDNNPLENPPKNKAAGVQVQGVAGARAITAGGFHTCILGPGNALSCLGYNFDGQLGSFVSLRHEPVTVTALRGATRVATGDGHACALVTTGAGEDQPVCWGDNLDGQLGAGLTPAQAQHSTVPVDVTGIAKADDLTAGNGHVCAIPDGTGTPKCWGRNGRGQLGNGTTTGSNAPVDVSSLTSADQISAGGQLFGGIEIGHTCAKLTDLTVRCWGDNSSRQLGRTLDPPNPTDPPPTHSTSPVVVQWDHDDDHLMEWKPPSDPHTTLAGAVEVASGGRHSCARLSNGRVRCWGENGTGQLGDGTFTDRDQAVTVDKNSLPPEEDGPHNFDPLTHVTAVAAGQAHSCAATDDPAVVNDNTVWCWGSNSHGQLGRGPGSPVPEWQPWPVLNIPSSWEIRGITAGDNHTCARLHIPAPGQDVTFVRCWGEDSTGQIGDGPPAANQLAPVDPAVYGQPDSDVKGVDLVVDVTAGRWNTCAVLIETSVYCTGSNASRQLGDGVGAIARTPVTVMNLATSVGGNSIPEPNDDTAGPVSHVPSATSIAVLTNDTDADGDPLTISQVEDPGRGTATVSGSVIDYTPDADFCDVDPTSNTETFQYWVTDGTVTAPGSWAFVTVTVACPNTAPDADDDAATTSEDTPINIDVLDGDTDINGDAITVASVTQPAHGVVVIAPDAKSVTYTPEADFFGSDSFTYTATDTNDTSAPATVTLTVTPVNDAPVAGDDVVGTPEDTQVAIAVTTNDSDIDSSTLGVMSATDAPNGFTAVTSPTEVTYTPDPDFCGVDTFTYRVTDGELSDVGTVTVNVSCQNDGPNAVDDSATTIEDVATVVEVLANDTDPENDALTVVSASDPAHGTATVNGGASITYTPDPDFCGADSFAYAIEDSNGEADSALVVPVIVICHNDPPVANDDSASTSEDTAVLVDVRANDVDVDGDTLTIVGVSDPPNGTTNATSSGLVSYTPDTNFCGADSFDYTVADPDGTTDTASVTVTVACVNDAPTLGAIADRTTPWGEGVVVPLSASDPDAGDTATYSIVSGPAGASIVGGSFDWTPTGAQVGSWSITLRATDGSGASDDETFAVSVLKRATSLTYTGASSAQYSDPAAVSAVLVDFEGQPVAGSTVSFAIGSRSTTASTDGAGVASGQLVVAPPIGSGTVAAGFGGDAFYLPTSASAPFTVEKELITTAFTGGHVVTTTAGSAALQLRAVVTEEPDGHLGSALSGVQVTFRTIGGDTLCTASVSSTGPGTGAGSCTTASLALGSRAVIARASGPAYGGPVDVGAFVVAPDERGVSLGAGRIDPGAVEDFAFWARPAVRKAPPTGEAVHIRRSGGTATVVSTQSITSSTRSCSGGKSKVCTALVSAVDASRWSVNLATGDVLALAGMSDVSIEAADVAEPGAGSDTFGVVLSGADSHTSAPSVLVTGNIRLL